MLTPYVDITRSLGFGLWHPLALLNLSKAYAELREFDDSRQCVEEAITGIETGGERCCEAEVHRTAGEIALMPPEPDSAKAEAYFERALAIARAQQAKSFELRAAISMARLWHGQGEREQARDLLAPIYSWFTEGFGAPDLIEAKTLLIELA